MVALTTLYLLPGLLWLVSAAPSPIFGGGPGGCIVKEYKTTKITNLTEIDPANGWKNFVRETCAAVNEGTNV